MHPHAQKHKLWCLQKAFNTFHRINLMLSTGRNFPPPLPKCFFFFCLAICQISWHFKMHTYHLSVAHLSLIGMCSEFYCGSLEVCQFLASCPVCSCLALGTFPEVASAPPRTSLHSQDHHTSACLPDKVLGWVFLSLIRSSPPVSTGATKWLLLKCLSAGQSSRNPNKMPCQVKLKYNLFQDITEQPRWDAKPCSCSASLNVARLRFFPPDFLWVNPPPFPASFLSFPLSCLILKREKLYKGKAFFLVISSCT